MSDSIITKITIQIELKVAVIFLHELMYLRGQKLGAYPDHLHGQGFDVPPVSMGLLEYPPWSTVWATNIISVLENNMTCF